MPRRVKQHIYVVDDQPSVRKVILRTLERFGAQVTCFPDAIDCLEQLRLQPCDLLITDVRMPRMDGIELLAQTRRIAPWVPVLVVTGYGDIPLAVKAMRMGAADFIEKPLRKEIFLGKIQDILKQNHPADPSRGKPLTKTEMTVLKLVADGRSNKEIAAVLRRSVRTIEDHRNHIMRKLSVGNVVQLIERAIQMGLVDIPQNRNHA